MVAAMELADAARRPDGTALGTAEALLQQRPAGEDIPARLAAALVRSALSRRSGQGPAAAAAAGRAQQLLRQLPEARLARHPGIRGEVLAARGAAELRAGDFDAAARTLTAASARTAAGSMYERARCLGYLALTEALRGQLTRADRLADQAAGDQPAGPAAAVARAWVHLDRGELKDARTQLKLAGEGLRLRPDLLADGLARVAAAREALAEGRAAGARELLGQARAEGPLPGWLGPPDCPPRVQGVHGRGSHPGRGGSGAERGGPQSGADVAAALARAWLADGQSGGGPAGAGAAAGAAAGSSYAEVDAGLTETRLHYRAGDRVRGQLALEHALRLASDEQLRLPFMMERTWLRPVLRQDPTLARAYQPLLQPG